MIIIDVVTVKWKHKRTLDRKKVYCLNGQSRQREEEETEMKRARLHHRPVREESKGPQHQLMAFSGSLYASSLKEIQDESVLARMLPINIILNKLLIFMLEHCH